MMFWTNICLILIAVALWLAVGAFEEIIERIAEALDEESHRRRRNDWNFTMA